VTERTLLPPDHPQAPKYWMHETGGQLGPAMERYLKGEPEKPDDVNLIRAYLRQWIDSPVWSDGVDGETRTELDELRTKAREIRSRLEIDMWLENASQLAIDPL
jgi:hypothetical protein